MKLDRLPGHVNLTYCTNIHAADGWPAIDATLRVDAVNEDDAGGIAKRQRPQEQQVGEGENNRVGAYCQRQRECNDDAVGGALEEQPDAELEILEQFRHAAALRLWCLSNTRRRIAA